MFSLRASGLYYSKTGKSLASKDISRLVEWKEVECYTGTQYKKFYRAPGQFCFSLVVSVYTGLVRPVLVGGYVWGGVISHVQVYFVIVCIAVHGLR